MNLLIVDDEAHVVNWIYELLSEQTDMELELYKARSAPEAVRLLERTRMDIVLTDIRMPGMSGLQLMELISARWPESRMVFLTGYSEFDYVYTAIKNPRVAYLLKTEDDEVIIDTVKYAYSELMRERTTAVPAANVSPATSVALLESAQYPEHIARFVAGYIAANLGGDLSLARLSEVTHYNPSYLSRIFKKQTGQTLNAYITDARLTRAAQLLRTTTQSVTAIAREVGFDSAQYFATAFRRKTGMSPQAYRDSI